MATEYICNKLRILGMLAISVSLSACSHSKSTANVEDIALETTRSEYYYPAFRQLPPEPVYGRVAYSYLPQPMPKRSTEKSPYLSPVIAFELPNSNLGEAISALAQTIGYRWNYPSGLRNQRVSIKTEATVDEILREIERQAGVKAEMDHQQRIVRVIEKSTIPHLPVSSQK